MAEMFLFPSRPALDIRPRVVRPGDSVHVAFRVPSTPGATSLPRFQVTVLDVWRRRVATLLREPVRPSRGVVCVEWDGRGDHGLHLAPGAYQLRVEGVGNPLRLERTLLVEW